MELRHLRYFVAVAEASNFTRAAEQQLVAQSALSQQIAGLERELDVRLFERERYPGITFTITDAPSEQMAAAVAAGDLTIPLADPDAVHPVSLEFNPARLSRAAEAFVDEAAHRLLGRSAADGILIITPEYNRSVPGVLKNALDWASRPKGDAAMTGKPSYVVGTSIGAIGTAVAQQHLRSTLSFLASPELAQPEVYLRSTPDLVDDRGTISDDRTRTFLTKALRAFHDHVERYRD